MTGFQLDAALDDAARVAFVTLFGDSPAPLRFLARGRLSGPFDRVAVVRFRGKWEGMLVLLCTEPLARRLVQDLLRAEVAPDEATLQDGLGEVVNCLAGAVKRLFIADENPFDLSLPACLDAAGVERELHAHLDWVGVQLAFDHEVFALASRLHRADRV